MKTAAIYGKHVLARENELTVSEQVQECIAYAKKHNYEVQKVYSDTLDTKMNTAIAFKQLLEDIKTIHYDVILIHSLTILSRSFAKAKEIEDTFKVLGIELISTDSIDIETVIKTLEEIYLI